MINLVRTGVLMAFLTAIFLAIGYLIAGPSGMVVAFVVALGTNLFAYWNSDKAVLGMYGAQEVDETTAPDLVHLVRVLSQNAGLPMPRVYIADNPQPNAFATGRSPEHAAVCATAAILERLNQEELAGVLAHELSHVKNRDTLIMTITATVAGAISMLANFLFFFGGSDRRNSPLGGIGALVVMILAPLAAALVQMAISRTREYEADHSGALLSGRPLWLGSALRRISAGVEQTENMAAEMHPSTAHLCIINPLHGGGLAGLFATHPSTEDRIARLQLMAQQMGQAPEAGPWG